MDPYSTNARHHPHSFEPNELFYDICLVCGYPEVYHPTQEERTHPMTVPFTMTQDSITVVVDGKTFTVQANTPQYHGLRDCLFREDWPAVSKHLTLETALQQWLGDKFTVSGRDIFTVSGRDISYAGVKVPDAISERILAMAAGGDSPAPLFAFYERLSRNPSRRSVQQLFTFLAHAGIPIEADGTFLAYKGVRYDYLDKYTGTINNEPGATVCLPRNQISDDPNHACHEGLHVGALGYAIRFASRVVIVRVDPEHVVCVPYDYSHQKMRVCEYTVVGNWVASSEEDLMPGTTFASDVGIANDDDEQDWSGDVEPELEADEDDEPKLVVVKAKTKPTALKAAKFNRMNPGKLMEQSIEDLRKYASAHLKIVGASKLPGGKSKLVSKILKARSRR